MWLGVDTGGTFTDFVLFDGNKVQAHKVLSTPQAPEQAILQGINELGLDSDERRSQLTVVHGSTVATNAVLEGKGVTTVYIANRGLQDVIQIGRQARRELYNLQPEPAQALIKPEHCLQADTRLGADGVAVNTISDEQLTRLHDEVARIAPAAVAINLLFSYLDDTEERRIAEAMPAGVFISRSSEVLNLFREYERGMATCLNSYIGPLMQDYLERLEAGLEQVRLSIMQSNGGTMSVEQAGRFAVNLLLSGPAGGLKGAQFVTTMSGERELLSFDMGGTSTDVALIDGEIQLTSEGQIAGYPVAVPMVDMHTIGAGGGSIARVDAAGMLLVGPESAGASPGPACYGKGGSLPTVTDANVVLGRIPPQQKLGGEMPLDSAASHQAIAAVAGQIGLGVEQTALGIIQITNEHMVQALRVISVQRGHDPRDYSLVSFGGAGGLHICALADALEMREAIIPMHSGVLSALGMLVASPQRELSHTLNRPLNECSEADVEAVFAELQAQGMALLQRELSGNSAGIRASLDLCYQGQSFTLELPVQYPGLKLIQVAEAFHEQHEARYGHRMASPLQLVNVRLALSGDAAPFSLPQVDAVRNNAQGLIDTTSLYGVEQAVHVYQREAMGAGQEIDGPALVLEKVATSYIEAGWRARVDSQGNLLLQKK